jgi:hypothetical protein
MKSGHIEFMQITTTHLSDRFIPVVLRMISIVTLSLSLKTNLIYRDRVFFFFLLLFCRLVVLNDGVQI